MLAGEQGQPSVLAFLVLSGPVSPGILSRHPRALPRGGGSVWGGEGVSGVAGRAAQLTSVLGGLRLGAQSEGRAGVLSLTPCAELALPGLHRTRPLFIALSRRTGMDVSVLVPGVLTRACSAGSP